MNTWYHKFNARWHMATETWYMYERRVPAVGGPISPQPNSNPAFCSSREITCFAPEWAVVNYLQREFSTKNFISLRTDFLNDLKGQRTGFKTRYSENTLMWGHWIGTTVLLRPELRFERAYDLQAYDGGLKHNQLTFSIDVIFKF